MATLPAPRVHNVYEDTRAAEIMPGMFVHMDARPRMVLAIGTADGRPLITIDGYDSPFHAISADWTFCVLTGTEIY